MTDFRRWMTLCEAREPAPPRVLYHGTNLFNACKIINEGRIIAGVPTDDDFTGAAVCLSSAKNVARDFAIGFERNNLRMDVGAIFALDGHKTIHDLDTSRQEKYSEREYRVFPSNVL